MNPNFSHLRLDVSYTKQEEKEWDEWFKSFCTNPHKSTNILKMQQPLIIHIPHSSARIPYRDGYVADNRVIENEIKKLTDWFTNELFTIPEMQNTEVIADFSRVFCDVERFENDADEPMAAFGMGVLYETTDSGSPLRIVTPQLRESVLAQFYTPHHKRLTDIVEAHLKEYGEAIILDAHSFSDIPFIRDIDQSLNRPDFCIGTDPFHTPAEWILRAKEYLSGQGYSVKINSPYAGTIVPLKHYGNDARVKSIMLEVNRKLYMDEDNCEKLAVFEEINATISGFLRLIKNTK